MRGWLKSLFVVTIFIDVCRGFSKGTWFEAQTDCQNRGGSLPFYLSNTTDEFYQWLAFHKRLSSWMKLLGCYKMNISTTTTQTVNVLSLGDCQSFCSAKNVSTFGLQNYTCMCIDALSDTSPLPIEKCSYNCSADMNVLPFNECGGPSVFNLYLSGTLSELVSEQNITCVAIHCGDDSKHLYIDEYNQSSGSSWGQSIENCSLLYEPGDFHLGNEIQGCGVFSKTTDFLPWLGIANQVYVSHSYHRRLVLKDEKILKCQKCSKGCIFLNCSKMEKYQCKDVVSSSSGSSTRLMKTNRPALSNITEVVRILESEDDLPPIATLFPVFAAIAVVAVVAVVVLLIVLFRRKTTQRHKQTKKHTKRSVKNAKNNGEMAATSTNYSTVKSQTERGIEEESPYSRGEDGVYDHLRDNQARRKETEKIYHHVSLVPSNYSEMSFIPIDRIDSIYDHCKSLQRTSQDNTYDRSDSFLMTLQDNTYDRSESFLRTSQDNTYYRSASFLRMSQDNTYDRSESFLRASQDNTYGRSASFLRMSQDNTYDRSESFLRTAQDNTYN